MYFANGQPCWVDIQVRDEATQTAMTGFLTALLGLRWEIGGPETGFYGMGFLGDAQVMAIGRNEHGAGVPVVHLHVDDIAASVDAVAAAGGSVFMGPLQIMEAGSMALATDSDGAVFGMWQGNLMPGFGIDNVHGAFCWFDHMSADAERAATFYRAAFGLGFEPMGDGGILTSQAGWIASVSTAPEGVAPFWNPIVACDDLEAMEARARALGCEVLMSRMAVPGGLASGVRHGGTGLIVTVFQSVPSEQG